jgi:mRNA interferase MazF
MRVARGQIVLVDFPFAGGGPSKVRPALVLQNDRDNARLTNSIVAMISSQTRRAAEATQVLIEVTTSDGAKSGLRVDSVIVCSNLFTVEQSKILRMLGDLTPSLMCDVDAALRVVFGLSGSAN